MSPVTSLGMRSGVNCTRLKTDPATTASALATSVLPSPGAPSISTWPTGEQRYQHAVDELLLPDHHTAHLLLEAVVPLREFVRVHCPALYLRWLRFVLPAVVPRIEARVVSGVVPRVKADVVSSVVPRIETAVVSGVVPRIETRVVSSVVSSIELSGVVPRVFSCAGVVARHARTEHAPLRDPGALATAVPAVVRVGRPVHAGGVTNDLWGHALLACGA